MSAQLDLPGAGLPVLPRCRCAVPVPGDVTVWVEHPHSRERSPYVEREWCETCDGWIRQREFPEIRILELSETAQLALRLCLAREWTASRERRSRAQRKRWGRV